MINAIIILWNMLSFQIDLKRGFSKPYSHFGYKYLHIDKNNLLNYINKKFREVCEIENVKVFDITYDEMNEKRKDDDKKVVGLFIFNSDGNYYEKLKSKLKKLSEFESPEIKQKVEDFLNSRNSIVPRIELCEQSGDFTSLHELGHYFLYKRKGEQSELLADRYIEEFFDTYLPSFFKWIFQIEIHVYAKKETELKFTEEESFMFWKDYQLFIS